MKKLLVCAFIFTILTHFGISYGVAEDKESVTDIFISEVPGESGHISLCWNSDFSLQELEENAIEFTIHYKEDSRLQALENDAYGMGRDREATFVNLTDPEAVFVDAAREFCFNIRNLEFDTRYYFAVLAVEYAVPEYATKPYERQVVLITSEQEEKEEEDAFGVNFFPARVNHVSSYNAVLYTSRELEEDEYYAASCSLKNTPPTVILEAPIVHSQYVPVAKLAANTEYECSISLFEHPEGGTVIDHSEYVDFKTQGVQYSCESPNVLFEGDCINPYPSCLRPPANSDASTCYDRIIGRMRIERFRFDCEENYTRFGRICVEKDKISEFQEEVSSRIFFTSPFSDISDGAQDNWSQAALYVFHTSTALEGSQNPVTGEVNFRKDDLTNRAELAKIINKLQMYIAGEDANCIADNSFPDVEGNSWYEIYVRKAVCLGLITGHGDGTYQPAGTVTRAQFIMVLARIFDLQMTLPNSFLDMQDISAWEYPLGGIVQQYNLFPETGNYLYPHQELKRGEMVMAIYQLEQAKRNGRL